MECLALIWVVLILRTYVEGNRFIIRAEHHALKCILDRKEGAGHLARWRLRHIKLDFEVFHEAEAFPIAPHALSGLPTTNVDDADIGE